jgi:hypothetical protein
MQRKIPLAGNSRCYLDVRRLLRPQSKTQRVEDLPLAEPSDTGCVVGSQVLRSSFERTDLELPDLRSPHTIQPSEGTRIRITATMASPARMTDDHEPPVRDLVLSCLT